MTVIPVLRSLRQEDQKFEDILGYYLVRPHLKKIIQKNYKLLNKRDYISGLAHGTNETVHNTSLSDVWVVAHWLTFHSFLLIRLLFFSLENYLSQ